MLQTWFGIDIASFQKYLNLLSVKKQGFTYVMIKCTEGSSYVNPEYEKHLDQAKKALLRTVAYHFLRPGNIVAQVANLKAHIIDPTVPVMVDVERSKAAPTLRDALDFVAEAEKEGLTVTLSYLPMWYWRQLGAPSLAALPGLVSSNYPVNFHQYASVLYRNSGGNTGPGWRGYGNSNPVIWQFGSVGKLSGYNGNVDVSAFKGSLNDLDRLFKNWEKVQAPPKILSPNIAEAVKYLYAAKRWSVANKHLNRAGTIQKVIDAARSI